MTVTARKDRPRSHRNRQQAAAAGDGDSVDQYLREVGCYPLLTVREELALGVRARGGDEAAVEELVSRNLRFVISVAKKYQNRGLPLSDLIGEGNVGLLTAARKFDPAQGVRFISYAVWWIRQAILSAVTKQGRIVRVPANRATEISRANRAADVLRQKLLREPSLREIADAAVLPLDIVRTAVRQGLRDVSLDSPVHSDSEQTLLDRYTADEEPDADDDAAAAALKEQLTRALTLLPERNAKILRLHFGLEGGREHTLEEIGEQLGVTRERIRQLRDRALRKLREGALAKSIRESAGFLGAEEPARSEPVVFRRQIRVARRRVNVSSRIRFAAMPAVASLRSGIP